MHIGASRPPLFGKAKLEVNVSYWPPLMPLGDAYRKVLLEQKESPEALLTIHRNRFTAYLDEMQHIQKWPEVQHKTNELPNDITLTLHRDPKRSKPDAERFMITVTKSRPNPKRRRGEKMVTRIMTISQEELGGPKYQVWSIAIAKVKAYLNGKR